MDLDLYDEDLYLNGCDYLLRNVLLTRYFDDTE